VSPGRVRTIAAVDQRPRPGDQFQAGASTSIRGVKPIAAMPCRAHHRKFQAIGPFDFVKYFYPASNFVILAELHTASIWPPMAFGLLPAQSRSPAECACSRIRQVPPVAPRIQGRRYYPIRRAHQPVSTSPGRQGRFPSTDTCMMQLTAQSAARIAIKLPRRTPCDSTARRR
jgi:hypothetical protein